MRICCAGIGERPKTSCASKASRMHLYMYYVVAHSLVYL